MNIFVLSTKPERCAQYHCDKHVVKMVLETAQLLSTVHHHSGTYTADRVLYKPTHPHHPCALWLRKSEQNYRWLIQLGLALGREYTYRYDKVHKSMRVIEWAKDHMPQLPQIERTPFVQCMPETCKHADAVTAYRQYYLTEKKHMLTWRRRGRPWWVE